MGASRITLFGGEPLLHPRFLDWVRAVRKVCQVPIWVNTNGYHLDRLIDHVDELFTPPSPLLLAVSKHTKMEPYGPLVDDGFKDLLERIRVSWSSKLNAECVWKNTPGTPTKRFYSLSRKDDLSTNYLLMSFCDQYNDVFMPHYQNTNPIQPWHRYSDTDALHLNHHDCHIKDYVQLYKGRLYKCPPRAVLNHTLDVLKLNNSSEWTDYYTQYKSVGTDSSKEEIAEWFTQQKLPENTCNMCGFNYSKSYYPRQEHLPKKMFNLKNI